MSTHAETLFDDYWFVLGPPGRIRSANTERPSGTSMRRTLLEAVIPVLEADALAVPDDDRRWFRLGAAREIDSASPTASLLHPMVGGPPPARSLIPAIARSSRPTTSIASRQRFPSQVTCSGCKATWEV